MGNSDFTNIDLEPSLLNSLLAHVAIINQKGILLYTNSAWKAFDTDYTQIGRPEVGSSFITHLQEAIELGNDYALKLLLGSKKVLSGDDEIFSLIYPVMPGAEAPWFNFTIQAVDEKGSRFIMIHEEVTSSVKARQTERESKNRYQIQFEQSLDGILITDTKGNVMDANPAASDILGWSKKELLHLTREEIMDTNDPNYIKALRDRKKSGIYKLETTLQHKNGHRVHAEVSSRAYRTKDGSLRAILSFRDISRRKSAEDNLLKTKHFTESALNSIPGIFFVLDEQGNFVRWNENMVTNLQYSAVELSEKTAFSFAINEEHKARIQSRIEECIEKGELTFETEIMGKRGLRTYHMLTKRFVEDGEVFIVGTGIDITESKQAELEKRKNRLMMQQLFKNAPMGIAILDTKSNIQEINSEFETLFGYPQQDIMGQNIDELLVPKGKIEEAKHISRQTVLGNSMQAESIRIDKYGREIPVLIGGVPVQLNDEIIAIYAIYVDVSEQYQYQQRIEKSLAEKETLLAELHHRVKNNLALISSMLELQVNESDHPQLTAQLNHTKNRILTIAAIHEVLYQSSDFNEITFDTVIHELLDSSAIREQFKQKNLTLRVDAKNLVLDISQSIPLGLLLNELLSLIFSHTSPDGENEIQIALRQYGKQIHLVIEGHKIVDCPNAVKEQNSLHNTLAKTLIQQLNGTMLWPVPEQDDQKFECIFSKKEGYGPARAVLDS